MKVGMISLGCDKNRVDSEKMLFLLKNAGYEIVGDEKDADIIIVNTCAFIESAKKEAIETIFDVASLKENGLKYLVVTGCFSTRYASNVDFPEVDMFISVEEEKDIVKYVDSLVGKQANTPCFTSGRILTTPAHYAYLKIADGCDNKCTYCAIPSIRGKYVSTPIEDLVEEAKGLVESGVKEIILVAQDTTNYGVDIYGKPSLTALLKELVKLDVWKIRILYAYPELIDDELLELINKEEKIAKYLDIPLQHADKEILRRMNRRQKAGLEDLVAHIRNKVDDIALRSSFICGFPFETEKEHEVLLSFLRNGVDYGGFFIYSPEEGTPAYNWKNRAKKSLVKKWIAECEDAQTRYTVERQKRFLDRTVEVIYEGIDYKKQCFYGRTEYNAPDIDTLVYFTSDFPLEIGRVYKVKIDKTDFNLYGKAAR